MLRYDWEHEWKCYWERRTHMVHGLFVEPPPLSSIPEHQAPQEAVPALRRELYSPPPPLIIRRETKRNKHDESEEFYTELRRKMKNYYRKIFENAADVSSDEFDDEIYHYNPDIDESSNTSEDEDVVPQDRNAGENINAHVPSDDSLENMVLTQVVEAQINESRNPFRDSSNVSGTFDSTELKTSRRNTFNISETQHSVLPQKDSDARRTVVIISDDNTDSSNNTNRNTANNDTLTDKQALDSRREEFYNNYSDKNKCTTKHVEDTSKNEVEDQITSNSINCTQDSNNVDEGSKSDVEEEDAEEQSNTFEESTNEFPERLDTIEEVDDETGRKSSTRIWDSKDLDTDDQNGANDETSRQENADDRNSDPGTDEQNQTPEESTRHENPDETNQPVPLSEENRISEEIFRRENADETNRSVVEQNRIAEEIFRQENADDVSRSAPNEFETMMTQIPHPLTVSLENAAREESSSPVFDCRPRDLHKTYQIENQEPDENNQTPEENLLANVSVDDFDILIRKSSAPQNVMVEPKRALKRTFSDPFPAARGKRLKFFKATATQIAERNPEAERDRNTRQRKENREFGTQTDLDRGSEENCFMFREGAKNFYFLFC